MNEIYKNLSLENLDGEKWKEIEGYNGDYLISNFGRVKSFKKWRGIDCRILNQSKESNGYLFIGLYKNGKKENKSIHILMFESFIEKIPEGCIIHHKDKTKDNFLDNFEVVTNEEHSSEHNKGENNPMYGVYMCGENNPMFGKHHSEKTLKLMRGQNNPNSVLTEQDIIAIKSFWNNNIKISNILLSKIFKVSTATISNIKTGKIWSYIKMEDK